MTIPRVILFLAIIFFAGQMALLYPDLPQMISTHFDGGGPPDGWMEKRAFVAFETVLMLFIGAECLLLPWLISRMPDSFINLPNKAHWLAPERRASTFAVMRNYFEWMGAATVLLFVAVNQLVFQANLHGSNLSGAIWLILGLFLFFVLGWMIKFIRQFKIIE